MSLRRTVTGEAFPYNLREGTKGVQLAQTGIEIWEKRAWFALRKLPI